jgi:hypothetical protein
LLWLHGNGGNLTYAFDSIRDWHRLGVTVVLVDYRGYGKSEGSPSEQGVYLDGEAAYQFVTEELRVPASRLVILGESLGGAPAIRLASKFPCAGLVTQSAFTSIPAMVRSTFPLLPWLWVLARTRFPNLDTIPQVKAPKLIIHSRDDEMIPFRMGRELFEAAVEPKQFMELDRVGHNFTLTDSRYWEGVGKFLDRILAENR